MSNVTVLGAGAWGTALALSALRAGSRVTLWARSQAAEIATSRATPRLPNVSLPGELAITGDMAQALQGADITILAVPVQHLRGGGRNPRRAADGAGGHVGDARAPLPHGIAIHYIIAT